MTNDEPSSSSARLPSKKRKLTDMDNAQGSSKKIATEEKRVYNEIPPRQAAPQPLLPTTLEVDAQESSKGERSEDLREIQDTRLGEDTGEDESLQWFENRTMENRGSHNAIQEQAVPERPRTAKPLPQNSSEEHGTENCNAKCCNKIETQRTAQHPIGAKCGSAVDPPESSSNSRLYGDKVGICIGIIANIVHILELYQMDRNDPYRSTAIPAVIASMYPLVFGIPAAITGNLWLSRMIFITLSTSFGYMAFVQYPVREGCEILTFMQFQVVLKVLANVSLSFNEKLLRLAFLFVVGSFVSIKSPNLVYVEDTLPKLGGTILLAIFLLYGYHFGVSKQQLYDRGPLVIMAILAVDLVLSLSQPITPIEEMLVFCRVTAFGCICAISTATFRKEIDYNEKLEFVVKERTKEIRLQNEKLRMVSMALQASETAIVIADSAGKIVWINSAFEQMSRKDEKSLIETPLGDTIHQLDRTRTENRDIIAKAFEDPTTPSEDKLQIGDSIFRLEVAHFMQHDHASKPGDNVCPSFADRFLVVFKDITLVRAREIAEEEANEKAMTAKAMANAMLSLTHELRTPLQGIMGVTSLLLQQASGASRDMLDSLELIMASSGLLLNLINNLLDIKKVTAKMMEEFPLSSVPAAEPINDAVGFVKPLASISSVKIVANLGIAEQSIVKSNSVRLQQVLINLLSNAIKYTKRGSEIQVNTHLSTVGNARATALQSLAHSQTTSVLDEINIGIDESSLVLVFSVSDCGPGIPADQAGRLFHRFAQLDTKPRRILGNKVGQPSGTGLGLNLCQEFVGRMHGLVWADNNSNGVGSSFSFYLPLVSTGNDLTPGLRTNTARSKIRRSISSKKPESRMGTANGIKDKSVLESRVLLVDDILINRKVLQKMLKRIGVVNTVTAESGEQALQEISKTQFDLVITDLQMPPGMSGTELSAAINKKYDDAGVTSARPIVVGLTADTSCEAVQQCAATGMADMLHKPLTLSGMKDYFEKTIPKLQAGVWYADVHSEEKGDDPVQ